MSVWIDPNVPHVLATPPSCLDGFTCTAASPEPWKGYACWAIQCACGERHCEVLGYLLSEFNPEYTGPTLYVSPFSFRCSACAKVTPILDTQEHGYDSEYSKLLGTKIWNINVRGTGDPKPAPCPACGHTEFAVQMAFTHSHFDHIEDDPELEPRAQDFFDGFGLQATCASCGEETCLSGLELA